MKHAYLIIAHNNFYILEKLLELLDDSRNDIYLHFDAKCKDFNAGYYSAKMKYASLYFVSRIEVYWGEYSLIEAELSLFSSAYKPGIYDYYHLLSGTDLPIKSQNYIHKFFHENFGYEFISCATQERMQDSWGKDVYKRFSRFWYTDKRIYQLLNDRNYNRYKNDFIVSAGSQWVSVTENFVKCILKHKKWIRKHFRYSHACDEVYKQCIAINTEFKERLYPEKKSFLRYSSNARLIDWSQGGAHPKTFTMDDAEKILNSDCLFARKFDENVDKEIVDYIYHQVNGTDF